MNRLNIDSKSIVFNITKIVTDAILTSEESSQMSAAHLQTELEQIEKKKKSLLDAFFSQAISKDDMKLMNAEYDRQIAELTDRLEAARKREGLSYSLPELEQDIRQKVSGIVNDETSTDHFYSNLLDHITAYPDEHVEVHLKLLPAKWEYVLESLSDSKKRS